MTGALNFVVKGLQRTQTLLVSAVSDREDPKNIVSKEASSVSKAVSSEISTVSAKNDSTNDTSKGEAAVDTHSNANATSSAQDRHQLRTIEQRAKIKDTIVFELDTIRSTIDYDRPMQIRDLRLSQLENVKPSVNGTANSKALAVEHSPIEYIKDRMLIESSTSVEDPLKDDLFLPYHRRLEREEKRMVNIEREHNAIEEEKLLTQLEQLKGSDWSRFLTTITAINDPRDRTELLLKRELCIAEIEKYLFKFRRWKLTEKMLKMQGDLGETQQDYVYDTDDDILKVEPVDEQEPDSIDSSVNKRPKLSNQHQSKPFVSFYTKSPQFRPRFDQIIRRDPRNVLPFGQAIPDIELKDFDIPPSWKR